MKKLVIFFIIIINLTFGFSASNAYEINNCVYGRFSFSTGWTTQSVTIYDRGEKYSGKNLKNNVNQALFIGVGNNFYFNIDRIVHPFIGIDIYGRIPLKGTNYRDIDIDGTEYRKNYKEFFLTHIKVGTKFNLKDTMAIGPYFFAGFNASMLQMSINQPFHLVNNKYYVNLSIGLALETVLYNRFVFGVEYRYSKMNHKYVYNISSHNIGLKLSIEIF